MHCLDMIKHKRSCLDRLNTYKLWSHINGFVVTFNCLKLRFIQTIAHTKLKHAWFLDIDFVGNMCDYASTPKLLITVHVIRT